MSRSFERVVIYLAYGFMFSMLALFVARASAWELKHDYKVDLTKPCAECLRKFAECMEMVDKDGDKREDIDPATYVDEKLSCVKWAAACTEQNKCGTKVVLDGK